MSVPILFIQDLLNSPALFMKVFIFVRQSALLEHPISFPYEEFGSYRGNSL